MSRSRAKLSAHFEIDTDWLAGLRELKDTFLQARFCDVDPAQFAVEGEQLQRLGLSSDDLRTLLKEKIIAQAVEVNALNESSPHLEPTASMSIGAGSCFFLTEQGLLRVDQAEEPSGTHAILPVEQEQPRWDKMQRVLWFGGKVVKRFRRPAPVQEAILDRFHKCGWCNPMPCPFPRDEEGAWQEKLHTAIKNLNRNQVNALLHFEGDGTGTAVSWSLRRTELARRKNNA